MFINQQIDIIIPNISSNKKFCVEEKNEVIKINKCFINSKN